MLLKQKGEMHFRSRVTLDHIPNNPLFIYLFLYNNQINVRALIGQSAVGYFAGKPTEKLHIF